MPLQLPILDDRTFEQLLLEAKQRIPVYTPEWTNFDVESDPGITIVQLFAFLTESLLYRTGRYPEANRLKFLQLLGIPLQPPAAADGLIVINNERGPIQELPLDAGVIVAAGNVQFLTRDGVNVLPLEGQVYYKKKITEADSRYAEFVTKYQAVSNAAANAALDAAAAASGIPVSVGEESSAIAPTLAFYETTSMPKPTPGTPNPVVSLSNEETIDHALYVALLAPKNVRPQDVREVIANKTLSIGVVPALTDKVPPLKPRSRTPSRSALPDLKYERAD